MRNAYKKCRHWNNEHTLIPFNKKNVRKKSRKSVPIEFSQPVAAAFFAQSRGNNLRIKKKRHRNMCKHFFSSFFFHHKWLTSLDPNLNLLYRSRLRIEVLPSKKNSHQMNEKKIGFYWFHYNQMVDGLCSFCEISPRDFFVDRKKSQFDLYPHSTYCDLIEWMWCKFFKRLDELICVPQKMHIASHSIRVRFSSFIFSASHFETSWWYLCRLNSLKCFLFRS